MSESTTKKTSDDYELRDECDLSQVTIVPKGRYATDWRQSKNPVVLEADVARAFPSDDAVNEALRLVLRLFKIPQEADTDTP